MDWNDPELKALKKEFLNSLPERLKLLRETLLQKNAEHLRLYAHRLSGAADSFGCEEIGKIASKMEEEILEYPSFRSEIESLLKGLEIAIQETLK